MAKVMQSEDVKVRKHAIEIIYNIIEAGEQGLKDGEYNPYLETLNDQGIIEKLILLLWIENNEYNSRIFAKTLAHLFKAFPLPQEMKNDLIQKLKVGIDWFELTLLAECNDNHEAILANDFEMKIFEFNQYTNLQLVLIINLLRYGTQNLKSIISLVKEKVWKLIDDKELDEFGEKQNWNQIKKEEIKQKAKEILIIIWEIEIKQFEGKDQILEKESVQIEEEEQIQNKQEKEKRDNEDKIIDKQKEKDIIIEQEKEKQSDIDKEKEIKSDIEFEQDKQPDVKKEKQSDIEKEKEKENEKEKEKVDENEKIKENQNINEMEKKKDNEKVIYKQKEKNKVKGVQQQTVDIFSLAHSSSKFVSHNFLGQINQGKVVNKTEKEQEDKTKKQQYNKKETQKVNEKEKGKTQTGVVQQARPDQVSSTTKDFVNISDAISQHFALPNVPPFKLPSNFNSLLTGLRWKNIYEILIVIPAASQLAELAFYPIFTPTPSVIYDILLPSLTGYIYMLKSLTSQLIEILKKFGDVSSSQSLRENISSKLALFSYPIETVSNIQSNLNTTLIQFCQIFPRLETNSTLPQLLLPRIQLLSSMTYAVETCQMYIEINNNMQIQSVSKPQIDPSVALASFKSAALPVILSQTDIKLRTKMYEELNQCMSQVQNLVSVAILGENISDKKDINQQQNIFKIQQTKGNETKSTQEKHDKKNSNESSSTQNKSTQNNKKGNNNNKEEIDIPDSQKRFKVIQTQSGAQIPLKM
ncbi:MAG: hypothetical protein EZS28_017870, partial [Streblomastix strix]